MKYFLTLAASFLIFIPDCDWWSGYVKGILMCLLTFRQKFPLIFSFGAGARRWLIKLSIISEISPSSIISSRFAVISIHFYTVCLLQISDVFIFKGVYSVFSVLLCLVSTLSITLSLNHFFLLLLRLELLQQISFQDAGSIKSYLILSGGKLLVLL